METNIKQQFNNTMNTGSYKILKSDKNCQRVYVVKKRGPKLPNGFNFLMERYEYGIFCRKILLQFTCALTFSIQLNSLHKNISCITIVGVLSQKSSPMDFSD